MRVLAEEWRSVDKQGVPRAFDKRPSPRLFHVFPVEWVKRFVPLPHYSTGEANTAPKCSQRPSWNPVVV